ncbi:MAG: AAA family ATPase [Gemmatimonadota bacterium]
MSNPRIHLQTLEIHRMPGFPPTRAFSIDELSPGINIIHGPQESGKTTITQAISLALHGAPDPTGLAILRGNLRHDDRAYQVVVDPGRRTFLRDGDPDPGPSLPPSIAADRYKLWLHELLQAEDPNRDFAQQILQESAGGYDIREARGNLGFRPSPSSPNIGERRDYNRQERELKEAIRNVIDPKEAEHRLQELKAERRAARAVQERSSALKRAQEYRQHQAALELAQRRLSELPKAVANVTGQEPGHLAKLRKELADWHTAVHDAKANIDGAQQGIRDAELPDEDPPEDLIPTLRRRIQKLHDFESRVGSLERETQKAKVKAAEAGRALGEITDLEALARVNTGLLHRSERIAENADAVRQEQAILDVIDAWLSEEQSASDPGTLHEGRRILRRWLQVPEDQRSSTTSSRLIGSAGGVVTALTGVSLIAFNVVSGGILLLAGLVLLFLWWRTKPTEHGAAARATYERDFQRTGLDAPPNWEREAVEAYLDRLEDDVAAAKLASEREQQRIKLAPDRETLEQRATQLAEDIATAANDLGVQLDVGPRSFSWFVRNLGAWQEARIDLVGAEEEVTKARSQCTALVEEIGDTLAPYGYEKAANAESALTLLELLDDRFRTYRSAKRDLEKAESDKEAAEGTVGEREQEIRSLFEALDLSPDDEAGLQQLCNYREDYEAALREQSKARPLRNQALGILHREPAYDDRMEELSETEIETELEGLQETLDRLETLQDQIPRLEQDIKNAKREQTIETAIEARDRAAAALQEKLEEETAQVVGWTVAEFVHDETKDHDRPAVFHRARELLATVTLGRYELQFKDSETPEFTALDTRHNEVKSLGQLSSGTRIQLLLAVRLAFVEQQEQGPMLPILLDETLANTDDIRARAIIDTVIEIARRGRQVFYVTAQNDEVRKWAAALENGDETDPPYQFINLAKRRSLTEELKAPKVEYADTLPEDIPEPDGKDHRTYGRSLSVTPLSPAADVGDTHIWHLVDDPNLISTLLQRGIDRWGQLRTLREHDGSLATVLSEDQWVRIQALAKSLSAFLSASSIGREKLIDRVILEQADGVTLTKLDDLADLAERLGGDPSALLDALAQKEVPRFLHSQRQKLEDFLCSEGFLDSRPKLSPGEVTQRTLAGVADEIRAGVIDRKDVLNLLKRITNGP